jgi:calcineurin-like phosphoesterase family protein
MTTWITSDLHFGHTNIMKFCPATRGHFRDINHMHVEMNRIWNERVQPDDLVYILGDVAFLPAESAVKMLQSLNGRKILIQGNHDRKLLKDPAFRACFEEVHADWVGNINGTYVHMYHYPISEFDRMHRGAVHFHGHLHGSASGLEKYRVRDVGFDATGQVVSDMDRMIADALKGEIRAHH